MKHVLKKLPIWLLMVWPYVFFASLLLAGGSFFGIYCLLTVVLCVINAVNACTYNGEQTARELGLWGMVMKLVYMPFYVVVVVMGMIGILSIVIEPSTASMPFGVIFMVIIGNVFMIISSMYCTKAVLTAKDMGIIKKESAMLLAITSFIMLADVICAVLIYNKIKKNKKIKGA